VLDSACYLLNYVGDVVTALCPSPSGRATSPPWEGELPPELDSDWTDDLGHEDDESGGEEGKYWESILERPCLCFLFSAFQFSSVLITYLILAVSNVSVEAVLFNIRNMVSKQIGLLEGKK